jgi:hypothetical protein
VVLDAFADVVNTMASGRRLELLAQGEHGVESLARMTGMAITTTSSNLQCPPAQWSRTEKGHLMNPTPPSRG